MKLTHVPRKGSIPAVALFFAPLNLVMGVLSIAILALLFQYSIGSIFGKDLPWYVDAIGGVVCNGFVLAVAFICWVARLLGYPAPFIH